MIFVIPKDYNKNFTSSKLWLVIVFRNDDVIMISIPNHGVIRVAENDIYAYEMINFGKNVIGELRTWYLDITVPQCGTSL